MFSGYVTAVKATHNVLVLRKVGFGEFFKYPPNVIFTKHHPD